MLLCFFKFFVSLLFPAIDVLHEFAKLTRVFLAILLDNLLHTIHLTEAHVLVDQISIWWSCHILLSDIVVENAGGALHTGVV